MPNQVDSKSDRSGELIARFLKRDRRALASILSLAQNEGIGSPTEVLPSSISLPKRPQIVGITGGGGAGKSTLVAELIRQLRGQAKRVAVLACDPHSPKSGGALLGDRIRVKFDPLDEDVYFRSFSTRGATGGVAHGIALAIEWLAAFGFDVILVETVGVGQDQTAVRELVDRLALIVTPASGDEVQWEKAGLIEVVDLVVVNKSDMPGASKVAAALKSALSLVSDEPEVPVLQITATSGVGVAELAKALFTQ